MRPVHPNTLLYRSHVSSLMLYMAFSLLLHNSSPWCPNALSITDQMSQNTKAVGQPWRNPRQNGDSNEASERPLLPMSLMGGVCRETLS